MIHLYFKNKNKAYKQSFSYYIQSNTNKNSINIKTEIFKY